MRMLFAGVASCLLVIGAAAQEKKADETKKAAPRPKAKVTLHVGDPAPALKASKWLQGEEVTKFEPGKVYVVEFWATWCGPCIAIMPHMSQLQAEYASKGVTFIGYSAKDPNNSEEKVAAFVKRRGPKLGYTFAYADNRDSKDAWMAAAGQGGIPCSFVVDKASKVAYIGHPMYLDLVLPKVVDGSWDGKKSADEVAKIDQEVTGVFKALRGDPEAGLKAIADFQDNHPRLKWIPYLDAPKLGMLLKAGKKDELSRFATEMVVKAETQGDPMPLRTVSAMLRTPGKGDKALMALALRAAEGVVKVEGENNAQGLINLASTYFAAGDATKAREFAKKAVAAAASESTRVRQSIEKLAKEFEGKE